MDVIVVETTVSLERGKLEFLRRYIGNKVHSADEPGRPTDRSVTSLGKVIYVAAVGDRPATPWARRITRREYLFYRG